MTITITHDDIRFGRHCDPDCCPVGRAISRAGIPHAGIIDGEVLVPGGPHRATWLPLPRNVRNWMRDFDCHQVVQPISFELEVPVRRRLSLSSGKGRQFARSR
jgi:hypothetical protein